MTIDDLLYLFFVAMVFGVLTGFFVSAVLYFFE